MKGEQWQKNLTSTTANLLKAADKLRTHLSNAPIDVPIEETLIKRTGQAVTPQNLLLLFQLLQGTVMPSVLDTHATVELLLSALSVTENRSQSSHDQPRILTFTSTVSFLITESDPVDSLTFDLAAAWQPLLFDDQI